MAEKNPDPLIDLLRMENIVKVFKNHSILQAYIYMKIYGKTAPSALKEVLNVSNAGIHRHLNTLMDAGLVEKAEIKNPRDKRFTSEYSVIRELHTLGLFDIGDGLREHAREERKEAVITEWEQIIPAISTIFAEASTSLMFKLRSCDQACGSVKIVARHGSSINSKHISIANELLSFGIIDEGQAPEFFDDVLSLITKYRGKNSKTNPKRPVVYSFNVIRFPQRK